MALDRRSMQRIARTVHRVERTPLNTLQDPVQRPSAPVVRWAISPSNGIPAGTNADGTFKSATCTIYDWNGGQLESGDNHETGKVYNWGTIAIPGNRIMLVIGVDTNEQEDTYAVLNVACGAS